MGRATVYCENCGNMIPEDEFAKGKAVHFQDKDYCGKCKKELGFLLAAVPPKDDGGSKSGVIRRAAQDPRAASGVRRAVGASTSSSRLPKIDATVGPERHPQHPHHAGPARKPKSPVALYAGIGGAVLVVIIIIIVAAGGKKGTPDGGTPGGADKAKAAYEAVAQVISNSPNDFAAILSAIGKAEPDASGSSYESKLKDLKKDYEDKKRVADSIAALKTDMEKLTAKIQGREDPAKKLDTELTRIVEASAKLQVFHLFEKDLKDAWLKLRAYEIDGKIADAEKFFKDNPRKWTQAKEMLGEVLEYKARKYEPLKDFKVGSGDEPVWTYNVAPELVSKAGGVNRAIGDDLEKCAKSDYESLSNEVDRLCREGKFDDAAAACKKYPEEYRGTRWFADANTGMLAKIDARKETAKSGGWTPLLQKDKGLSDWGGKAVEAFKVVNDEIVAKFDGGTEPYALLSKGEATWTDYSVEFEFKVVKTKLTLALRTNGEGSMPFELSPQIELTPGAKIQLSQWYRVRIELQGENATISWPGQQGWQSQAFKIPPESKATAGQVAFALLPGDEACIRDIKVKVVK